MSKQSGSRRLAAILRSIETIEERANKIHSQYATSDHDLEHLSNIAIDDTNTDLQVFFQHFEQLLQIDLKNRKSLLNHQRNYWHFFALALKESKGLYDTILYVMNCQEVKTSMGRGRLFIRFCLQNHRLGDVIQQSFMMKKIVHQFYAEECFWTTSTYINRIIQVLYQLNDVQFDLFSAGQYQLDICWPCVESSDVRLKNSYESSSRLRTNSISSCLSMDSLPGHSMFTSSISIAPSSSHNFESSMNLDGSYVSSIDEDPEKNISFWKERCHDLEEQITSNPHHPISTLDAETQCSIDQHDENTQTSEENDCQEENPWKVANEKARVQIDILQDEIKDLNFQLSSFVIQQAANSSKLKDHEREVSKYQSLIDKKTTETKEMQRHIDEQAEQIKSIQEQHEIKAQKQEKRIVQLSAELDRVKKSLEGERIAFEKERLEQKKIQEQLELSLHERTLDFEEMKRRLVKAVKEKADLFNSIHSYEVKLEEEQSRQWVHDDDVHHCNKCNTAFGWTLRKYRCRHCQKIFCYYCSNHSKPGSTPSSSQHRLCDYCYETYVKESLMSNYTLLDDPDVDQEKKNEPNINFEVRSECLPTSPSAATNL